MDLLAKRYASPFLMLDEFIRLQQLHNFVIEVLNIIAEEKVHDARWQFYLHKVYGMSFDEYVRRCEQPQVTERGMTHKEIGNVIEESRKMLDGFVPE